MNRGIIYALGAYLFWGLHPIYWKQLHHVPSLEIVSHRIIWSLLFFSIIICSRKDFKGLIKKVKTSNAKWILFFPALLIGSNWALYIWAVNSGYIIETSLGYFISPLISVLLGVVFLSEKLRTVQWIAVLIAVLGVFYMTFIYGQFPWISIFLACTWGLYGLLRKKSSLNSIEGLTLEAAFLSLPVLIYIIYITTNGESSFLVDTSTSLLLIGSSVISGLPLLIFIAGARLIPLSLIGILQYVYPTLLFLIGFYVYGEPLSEAKITGFSFIWIALIIYSIEQTIFLKKRTKQYSTTIKSVIAGS